MAPKPPTFGAPRRSRDARLFRWGPRHGPQTPGGSERSGGAVALLYLYGGPDMAPKPRRSERPGGAVTLLSVAHPARFGAARRSRGAPLNYGRTMRRGWRREKWADIVAAANRFA